MKMAVATPNRFRGSIQDRKFHRHRHVPQDDFTLGRRVVVLWLNSRVGLAPLPESVLSSSREPY